MRVTLVLVFALTVLAIGCAQESGSLSPTSPSIAALSRGPSPATSAVPLGARSDRACWGEATQAFAQLGEMGYHASHQDTPRLGLRNVARLLHDLHFLRDDTLQSLGAFLSSATGLSIASCL